MLAVANIMHKSEILCQFFIELEKPHFDPILAPQPNCPRTSKTLNAANL